MVVVVVMGMVQKIRHTWVKRWRPVALTMATTAAWVSMVQLPRPPLPRTPDVRCTLSQRHCRVPWVAYWTVALLPRSRPPTPASASCSGTLAIVWVLVAGAREVTHRVQGEKLTWAKDGLHCRTLVEAVWQES